MNPDQKPHASTRANDKYATTKQGAHASTPLALQLQSLAFPIAFGRYHLTRVLGEGTMGAVYLGTDTQLGRDVAIKIPKFDDTDLEAIRRFQREARAMATLRHANICPVYDVGELDDIQYFTMAYIEGQTLRSHLERGKTFACRDVAQLMLKLAQAVEQAHRRGIVHRDLKPSNIIIDQNDEPVVMDFGLARLAEAASSLTRSGLMLGTPAYMAPEQVRGELECICPASDIYSMGAMMYELAAGRLAFDGDIAAVVKKTLNTKPEPPSSWAPAIDPAFDKICLRAMEKMPSDRYASGGELAEALRDYLTQSSDTVAPPIQQAASVPGMADEADTRTAAADTTFAEPSVTSLAALRKRSRRKPTSPTWLLWSLAIPGIGLLFLIVIFLASRDGESNVVADSTKQQANAQPRAAATEAVPNTQPISDFNQPPNAKSVDGLRGSPQERPPLRTAEQIIGDFDRNGDGKLQVVELPFDQRPRLARADVNQDGVITQQELEVLLALLPPPRDGPR